MKSDNRVGVVFLAVIFLVAVLAFPVGAVGSLESDLSYTTYTSFIADDLIVTCSIEGNPYSGAADTALRGIYVGWTYSDSKYNLNIWLEFFDSFNVVFKYNSALDGKYFIDFSDEALKSFYLRNKQDEAFYLSSLCDSLDVGASRSDGYTFVTYTLYNCDSSLVSQFVSNNIDRLGVLRCIPFSNPRPFVPETSPAPWSGLDEPTSPPLESGVENILDDGRYDSAVSGVVGLVADAPFTRYQAAFSFLGVAFNKILQKVPVFDDLAKFFAAFAVFNIIFGGFAVAVRAFSNESAREARAQKRALELDRKISERRRAQMLHDEKLVRSINKERNKNNDS